MNLHTELVLTICVINLVVNPTRKVIIEVRLPFELKSDKHITSPYNTPLNHTGNDNQLKKLLIVK